MSYLGRSSEFGVRSRYIYTAAGSETSISGADDNNNSLSFTDGAYVDVYLNGVLLVPAVDYNTSTANTIAGLSALSASDVVEVVVYDVFNVADTVPASTGGTFNGNVTATAFYGDGSNLTGIEFITKSTTAPTSPTEGDLWYDTGVNALKSYDGTSWSYVGDQTATITDVDFLIVAGGGGGSQGGGGAGGYQYLTNQTLSAGTTYTVTVGGGGAAKTNGGDSSISGLGLTTSIGGGRGGEDLSQSILSGADGGSGGGNKYSDTGAGGQGTTGQGNDGGSGSGNSAPYDSGGGGGAGASASGRNAGNGSAPSILNTTTATAASIGEISGSSVYFSGGGGGGSDGTVGTGGLGGGGDGVINATPNNGTANTGGGSGGRNNSSPWGSGGSGVVIIRVPTASYSGTYTGSSVSVQTEGTDTLVIFKSSGSYTA